MSSSQHSRYLESKVLTAASHQLHLMLIEGALRFGRQARHALESGDHSDVDQPLSRAIQIVGEMLVGVRSAESDVNSKLVSLYAFILKRLTDAKFDKELGKLDEALSILEYERETWHMLCKAQETDHGSGVAEELTAGADGKVVHQPPLKLHSPPAQIAGLSLEA